MDYKYLEAEIENLKEAVHELKETDQRQTDDYTQQLKQIDAKLDKALDQLAMYRHFTVFIRAVLVGIIMIVTLKFGAIKDVIMGKISP